MRISDWSSDVCSSDLLGLTRSPAQSLAEGQVASPSPWAATLRRSLRILGLVGFAVALSSVWGIDLFHAASTQLGERVVRGIITVAITIVLAYLVWELARTALAQKIGRASCRERVCQYV